MTWQSYTRDFNRSLPKGSEAKERIGGGVVVSIPCTGGHSETLEFFQRIHVDKIKSTLTDKGWVIRGKKATCKACQERKKEQSVTEQKTPATSDSARAAKREAFAWLMEAFDVDKGQFKGDVSDATIAKETGLSEQAVINMREEAFGPLKEPHQISQLRERIAVIETSLSSAQSDAAKIFGNVQSELDRLKKRLDQLVEKNQW